MKRNFIFIFLLSIGASVMAQNVVVQTTNNPIPSTQEDCAFRINGICSTEDIGGVDVQMIWQSTYSGDKYTYNQTYSDIDGYLGKYSEYACILENYHQFPVSVLLLLENEGRCSDKTISIVVKANSKKMFYPSSCGGGYYTQLKGIITRKL